MDHRKALPPGSLLRFPGMCCTIATEIGRGSNAIVYQASYPDLLDPASRHIVLIKELFPFDRAGRIWRDGQDDIVCEPPAQALMDLHRRSFASGNRVHLELLARRPELAGGNLNTFPLHATSYTVLGWSGGRSLEASVQGGAEDLRALVRRMLGLLDALEGFHESGFLHLDIAPDNILLLGRGEKERVLLIDYNSVSEMDSPDVPVYYSVKTGYSPPEVRLGRRPCPASDLYAVCAVFFRCLTGRALTAFETSRPAPPEVSDCRCVRDQPETVSSLVRQILRRGLQALPAKRFQSVSQLRAAFQELLDRIDGVGVTHWALWESGRRMVQRTVRENPSLAYLLREETLYPCELTGPEGEPVPAGDYLCRTLAATRGSLLLMAPGGMGKTTALLRAVLAQGPWSPRRPALVYLSLYGWKAGDPNWIHDRILEELRFRAGAQRFEDARRALDRLIAEPLHTSEGERPVLLLLLDGLNEAAGETGPLLDEILHLSRMGGVSLLTASRGEEAALPFPRAVLSPLEEETVAARLAEHGLLLPEVPAVRELLRTPLMLSIFLRASLEEGRQLAVEDREGLLDAYLAALTAKELRALPEDTPERWQIEAAVAYVLPAVADALQKEGRALEDRELLAVAGRCWRVLSSRALRRAFPQWIGHSRGIRGTASNAEEWYGIVVQELLWKRMGLLTRNERGAYQTAHPLLGEHLAGLYVQIRRQVQGRRRVRAALAAGILALALLAGWALCRRWLSPRPYNEIYAEEILAYGVSGYVNAGTQYEAMLALCAEETPGGCAEAAEDLSLDGPIPMRANLDDTLEELLASGEVMPSSGEPLDETHCRELLALAGSRREEYEELAEVLVFVTEDSWAARTYGSGYRALLRELLETDADIAAALYRLVCETHIEREEDALEAEGYHKLMASVPEQNEHLDWTGETAQLERTLAALQGKRVALRAELDSGGAAAAWKLKGGGT